MKTSSPYGPGETVKSPPESIANEQSKASSKAKARYPHSIISTNQTAGGPGAGGKRALGPTSNSIPTGA
jgi:hypothetical protein